MGLDRTLIALPDDCEAFSIASQGTEYGASLQYFWSYMNGRVSNEKNPSEIDKAYSLAARKIVEEHPGIEGRICSLDRMWDVLHFLLSENRRCNFAYGSDLGSIAVGGEAAVHEFAVASQGVGLKRTSSKKVKEVATWLAQITKEDLKANFHPFRMEIDVYKFQFGGQELDVAYQYFVSMQQFYLDVAECEEGVLVITD